MNRIVVPLLFMAGIMAALLRIASLAVGKLGGITGLLLLFGAIGAIATALLGAMLMEISNHLAVLERS